MQEILSTEKAYVSQISLLIKVHCRPPLNPPPLHSTHCFLLPHYISVFLLIYLFILQNYKGPLNTLAMTNSDLVKQEDIKVMFSNIHLILPLNQVRTPRSPLHHCLLLELLFRAHGLTTTYVHHRPC